MGPLSRLVALFIIIAAVSGGYFYKSHLPKVAPATQVSNAISALSPTPTAPSPVATTTATSTPQTTVPASSKPTATQASSNKPSAQEDRVTHAELEKRLSQLSDSLNSKIKTQPAAQQTSDINAQLASIYRMISLSQSIGQLTNTSITTPSISAPAITGGSISGSSINVPTITAGNLLPGTSGSITDGITHTLVATSLSNFSGEDSQKFMVVASDGFVRFVYMDDFEDLHFVQCTNADCSTKINTTLVTGSNLDQPVIIMGEDGFARIIYDVYNTPNEQHFVQCTNAGCSTNVDTIIATSVDNSGNGYYAHSMALGLDGFVRITYEDYSNPGASDLHFVQCTNVTCSTKVDTTVIAGSDTYYEQNATAIASDGFARIAYVDSLRDEIHYVQCTNVDCSTNTDTMVDPSAASFYLDMVLGSDDFGRIIYEVNGVSNNFIQCTNADCSTKNTTIFNNSDADEVSLVMGDDDLPRISSDRNGGVDYFQCLNADCSTKNITVISNNTYGYPHTIALGADGFARILYPSTDRKSLYLATLHTDDGSDIINGSLLGSSGSKFGQIFSARINTDELYLNGQELNSTWIRSNDFLHYGEGNVNIGWATTTSYKLNIDGDVGVANNGSLNILTGNLSTPFGGFGSYQNLMAYSDEFGQTATWGTYAPPGLPTSVTSNSTTSPDGTLTADHIIVRSGSPPWRGGSGLNNTFPVAGSVTFSIWIKSDVNPGVGIYFDIGDTSCTPADASFIVSTVWQRYSCTSSTVTTSNGVFADFDFTGEFDVWGAQLEYGTKPGIYVHTDALTSTNATRNFGSVVSSASSTSLFQGKVGLATTSPWRTLAVTGTVGFDGLTAGAGAGSLCLSANKEVTYSAGATCTVSSQRFKHDIATSTEGLAFVEQLRPVTFLYNDNIGVPGEQFGFIAEEVEKLDPRLVVHDADGLPFSVRYENMTAVLAKAIQEQQIEIETLKADLASSTSDIHDTSGPLSDLAYYAGQVIEGVVRFSEIVTEKITATLGVFKRVDSDEIHAKNFCLGDTCVTEAEFKALLEKNGITSSPPAASQTDTAEPVGTHSADIASSTAETTAEASTTPESTDIALPIPDSSATTTDSE